MQRANIESFQRPNNSSTDRATNDLFGRWAITTSAARLRAGTAYDVARIAGVLKSVVGTAITSSMCVSRLGQ